MHKWGRCGSRRPGKAPSSLTYLHNKRSELEALVQGNQSQPPLALAPPLPVHRAWASPTTWCRLQSKPTRCRWAPGPIWGKEGARPQVVLRSFVPCCRPQKPWNEARGEGGGPSPSLPALPPPPGSGRLSRSLRNVARPGVQGLASRLQLFSCSQGGRVGRVGTWEAEPAWGLVSRRIHIY